MLRGKFCLTFLSALPCPSDYSDSRYKRDFDDLQEVFCTGSLIEHSCKTAFLGMALLQNMRVLTHRDNSDDREGFVCMTNFGKYKGGCLLIGSDSIQYKIKYKAGDIVLFNSLGQVPPSSVGRKDKAILQLLKSGSGPPYVGVFLTVECDYEHGVASPSSFNMHLIRALDDQTCPIEGDYNMSFSFRTPLVSQNHLNSPENEPSLPILREIGMLSIRIPQQGDVAAQRRELDAQHRSSAWLFEIVPYDLYSRHCPQTRPTASQSRCPRPRQSPDPPTCTRHPRSSTRDPTRRSRAISWPRRRTRNPRSRGYRSSSTPGDSSVIVEHGR